MKSLKAIDMNSSQLKNVAAPSADADATNKAYVDAAIAAAGVTGSVDNLVVTDEGDYYSFDITSPTGAAQMTDMGTYYILSITGVNQNALQASDALLPSDNLLPRG